MGKEHIKGLPKDLPAKALDAMRKSVANEAGVPIEDVLFDGDVVRLVSGEVIGKITTHKLGNGATAVGIAGKRMGEGDKVEFVSTADEDENPLEGLAKLLGDATEVPKKMAQVQIDGNKVVIDALDDIEDMVRKLRSLLKQVNKQLEELQN